LNPLPRQQDREGSATISGKVTIDGKPASGILLILSSIRANEHPEERMMQGSNITKTVTDSTGHYRFSKLLEGTYSVNPFSPSLISDAGVKPGNSLAVDEGEEVDGIDFDLKTAGVITGTVTSSDARPLIGLDVNALPDYQPGDQYPNTAVFGSARTDDRGAYRIFGLNPGRYRVAIANSGSPGMNIRPGAGSYRDHDDPSKPGVIILAAATEASGIDIRLAPPEPTFEASGRVVDQTGVPVPDINVLCEGEDRHAGTLFSPDSLGQRTNTLGEFRVRGLKSGSYAVAPFMLFASANEYYGEPVKFEVKGSNVTGLEIKIQKGMTVFGQVVLEGSDDEQTLARLHQYQIMAATEGESRETFSLSKSPIGPGGQFALHGLAPGKLHIVFGDMLQQSSFQISRVELNGIQQNDAIQVNAGQDLEGVKVVVLYANCSIHGRVSVTGGKLPKGSSLVVSVMSEGSDSSTQRSMVEGRRRASGGNAYVEAGGFKVEGLPPGDYQVRVQILSLETASGSTRSTSTPQTVTLTNGQDAEVNLNIDLAAPTPPDKSSDNSGDRSSDNSGDRSSDNSGDRSNALRGRPGVGGSH
jgi:hypothetical protein